MSWYAPLLFEPDEDEEVNFCWFTVVLTVHVINFLDQSSVGKIVVVDQTNRSTDTVTPRHTGPNSDGYLFKTALASRSFHDVSFDFQYWQ